MKIHASFPKYQEFDPLVPIWRLTHNVPGCMHRFFDTSPISPSGRYLAVFRFLFENRQPQPGEKGEICLVDLETGKNSIVSETCGWEPQLGANVNWGGSDHELYFNDVDTKTWKPFAWKLDPLTGARERMEGTVYHASSDGRWLISANMCSMRVTQPGYGVRLPDRCIRRNRGLPTDDGFYLTDTTTGKCKLLISIKDMVERSQPAVTVEDPSCHEFYGFHSKFNPQGDRLMLSLRWFRVKNRSLNECAWIAYKRARYFKSSKRLEWRVFTLLFNDLRFAWVTTNLDGSPSHCAIGPEQWEKNGHHATWFPDGKRISMNLDLDREKKMRFVEADAEGRLIRKMHDSILGSGHPSVHPDGRHLVTDAYAWESLSFSDGTVPIRWVDLESGSVQNIARVNTMIPQRDLVLRVDPHPAWDRTFNYVVFNAFLGGTREVLLADMRSLL